MNLKTVLRPLPHLERNPIQHGILVVVGASLALGALIGIAWAAGFERVLDVGAHVDGEWLPVALGMEVAAYLGYIVAYREIARVEGGPRIGMGRAGAIVAAGFGVFVIRGGFVVDRHALEEAGASSQQARVRVVGLGLLEYAVLAPAVAVAAIVILARGTSHPSLGFTLPWAIAVPLGFAAAALALGYRDRVRGESGWRNLAGHGLDGLHMLRRLAAQPREHAGAFLGAALYWLGDIGCLWACLRAFHASPNLAALLIGYATGYALTRRSLPLGGAGTVEVLVSFALAWTGIPLATAVLAVCAYRFFNLWLPLVPAAVGLRHIKRINQVASGVR
ncbi:MAG TPA: lysylphosphatidylglycerol synthase transmembrane domain-containing protein [Gaiellaceae bacterium]|nr:lysylphosphatidylglycerol synthase transmembrane domain-containing protein [Gaiellaceae bacterium]